MGEVRVHGTEVMCVAFSSIYLNGHSRGDGLFQSHDRNTLF